MGRGRQKAKHTKVARDLKYFSPDTNYGALEEELASNPRLVFSRAQLMDRVWGHAAAFDTGTVTVHIRRLREKIEDDPSRPSHVETVWGVGYRFTP